jgi:hypothetical protein
MLTDEEWRVLIDKASSLRPNPVRAVEYRRKPGGSVTAPPLLACDDDEEYWVKHCMVCDGCPPASRTDQTGGMVTDHVVGLLAAKIAPDVVPSVKLIEIGANLITADSRLANACNGLAHGSRNASTNCTGRTNFMYGPRFRLPANRPRLASLAVLYGLAVARDHQVIFSMEPDSPLVFSVDHGNFLPGGPTWSARDLLNSEAADLDGAVITKCRLESGELSDAIANLERLAANDVAYAVAVPPDEWCFPVSDRIALAGFLWSRREAILQKSKRL